MSPDFFEGYIKWENELLSADKLEQKIRETGSWQDGFAAFSNDEIRLRGDKTRELAGWLTGRIETMSGIEGFLMEAGLWKNDKTVYEELAIEREGENFFVQHWRLDTAPESGVVNCFFRKADTFLRGNIEIFKDEQKSMEVVIPQFRLRLYLTRRTT